MIGYSTMCKVVIGVIILSFVTSIICYSMTRNTLYLAVFPSNVQSEKQLLVSKNSQKALSRFMPKMAVVNSIIVSVVASIYFLTLGTGNVCAHVKVLSSSCMIQLDTFASWLKCPNDDIARGHDGLHNSLEKVFCCGPLRNRHCCSLSQKMSEDPRFDPQNYREDLAFEDKYEIYVDKNNDDIPIDRRGGRFWMYLLTFSLTLSFTAISIYFFGAVIWMTITTALWCCFSCKKSSPVEEPKETGFKRGTSDRQNNKEQEQLVHVVPRKTYNTIRAPSHVDLYTQAPPKYHEYQV